MGIMRVALYARVSTLNGQNPETQLIELREYAARREWQVAGEYVDAGVSGSKDSRPSLNRLMAHAHQRRFDAILVWKLDRFGRSLKHLVTAIAELEALGVTFVSLKDNWDLSTPSGRLMFQIVGAMAEFERSLIVERIKAGMRRRLEGLPLGRAPPGRQPSVLGPRPPLGHVADQGREEIWGEPGQRGEVHPRGREGRPAPRRRVPASGDASAGRVPGLRPGADFSRWSDGQDVE